MGAVRSGTQAACTRAKTTIEQGPKKVGLTVSFCSRPFLLFKKAASSNRHHKRSVHDGSHSTSISSDCFKKPAKPRTKAAAASGEAQSLFFTMRLCNACCLTMPHPLSGRVASLKSITAVSWYCAAGDLVIRFFSIGGQVRSPRVVTRWGRENGCKWFVPVALGG